VPVAKAALSGRRRRSRVVSTSTTLNPRTSFEEIIRTWVAFANGLFPPEAALEREPEPEPDGSAREAWRARLLAHLAEGRSLGPATWGSLSPPAREALSAIVRGRHVLELSAGNLVLSHELLDLGAAGVLAVDRALPPAELFPVATPDGRIVATRTIDYADPEQCLPRKALRGVVFVSWPSITNPRSRESQVMASAARHAETSSTSASAPATFSAEMAISFAPSSRGSFSRTCPIGETA